MTNTPDAEEVGTPHQMLNRGGEWLAVARTWLQWNTANGDSVTWGSDEFVKGNLSVRQFEELAATVALSVHKSHLLTIDELKKQNQELCQTIAGLEKEKARDERNGAALARASEQRISTLEQERDGYLDKASKNAASLQDVMKERDGLKKQFAEGERRWERMRAELAESDNKISAMRRALEDAIAHIKGRGICGGHVVNCDITHDQPRFQKCTCGVSKIFDAAQKALTQSPPVEEKDGGIEVPDSEIHRIGDEVWGRRTWDCERCGDDQKIRGYVCEECLKMDKARLDWLDTQIDWRIGQDIFRGPYEKGTLRSAIDSAMSEKGER